MSIRNPFAVSASILAFVVGAPAFAQQFYVGGAVELGSTEMSDCCGGEFEGDLRMGSVLGGLRFDVNANYFVAGEVETSLFTSYETDTWSGDDIDRVTRARVLAGYDFGQIAAFAAVGGTWVSGPLAGSGLEDSAEGWNYGIGGNYAVNDRVDVRLEVIHDETEFENGTYSWDNTSLRAGAIVNF